MAPTERCVSIKTSRMMMWNAFVLETVLIASPIMWVMFKWYFEVFEHALIFLIFIFHSIFHNLWFLKLWISGYIDFPLYFLGWKSVCWVGYWSCPDLLLSWWFTPRDGYKICCSSNSSSCKQIWNCFGCWVMVNRENCIPIIIWVLWKDCFFDYAIWKPEEKYMHSVILGNERL